LAIRIFDRLVNFGREKNGVPVKISTWNRRIENHFGRPEASHFL
jgi:hypothetical protein